MRLIVLYQVGSDLLFPIQGCSTIGAEELNDSVRKWKRWNLTAVILEILRGLFYGVLILHRVILYVCNFKYIPHFIVH